MVFGHENIIIGLLIFSRIQIESFDSGSHGLNHEELHIDNCTDFTQISYFTGNTSFPIFHHERPLANLLFPPLPNEPMHLSISFFSWTFHTKGKTGMVGRKEDTHLFSLTMHRPTCLSTHNFHTIIHTHIQVKAELRKSVIETDRRFMES